MISLAVMRAITPEEKNMTNQRPKVALVLTTQKKQQHHDSSLNICVYPGSAKDLLRASACRCDSLTESREKRNDHLHSQDILDTWTG